MIRVDGLRCGLDQAAFSEGGKDQGDGPLFREAARALGVAERDVASVRVVRRSVDARRKGDVHFVVNVAVSLRDASAEDALVADEKARRWAPVPPLQVPDLSSRIDPDDAAGRPLVVGTGPAGLFCAVYLARAGLRPLVIERGGDVDERARAVAAFNGGGPLDPDDNVQFGEGGAGTFSDGKLTTGTKHPMGRHVVGMFLEAGAPPEIAWEAHPHIGSDLLPAVVRSMRHEVERRGGTVLFHTRLDALSFEGGRLVSARLSDLAHGTSEEVPVRRAVLACGHSARDVFSMLDGSGVGLEQKPFSMGVRIEHLQRLVDRAQWGSAASSPALSAAEYKMVVHTGPSRSAYTFCMCPGGTVVAAASEAGGVVTNGMSDHARDGANANSGLLVNVAPGDFGAADPLAGVRLQREVEQRAFKAALAAGGTPYQAPAQTVGDFLAGRIGVGNPAQKATYPLGIVPCDLRRVLPSFVCDTIAAALPRFDRRLHGFADPGALMTAPETRSSSPVRVVRDRTTLQARLPGAPEAVRSGLFPCGEGAGYAGGIVSAAADGLRVAQALAQEVAQE